jgi:Integral membrane protein TerC family
MMTETAAASFANIGSSSSDYYYSSREITRRQLRFCRSATTTVLLFAVVFVVSANRVSQIHAFTPATYTFVSSFRGGDPRTQRSAAFAGARRNTLLDITATTTTTPLYKRPQQHSVLLSASKSNEHTTTAAAAGDLSSSGGGGGGLETAAGSVSATTAGNPPFSVTLDDGSKYSYGEAIQRTLGWVGAAIIFGGGLWAVAGSQTGQEFFAGYLVEQSLSVDNLFVFLLLFEYFKVPLQYQDRVLNWGIYGAVIMRAIMIGIGAAALQQFHAILLVFAGILVYSSASFFIGLIRGGGDEEDEDDPGQNSIVRFSRSLIQATEHFDGDRFFTLVDGVRQATPLFICMIAVEISDVVFAVDSIPAVFGVTEVS